MTSNRTRRSHGFPGKTSRDRSGLRGRNVSPTTAGVSVPGPSSLGRSKQKSRLRPSCKAAPSRRPHICTFFQVCSYHASRSSARSTRYFFSSMGWPQHVAVPLPPRVAMASAPHFVHKYLFPTRFAMLFLLVANVQGSKVPGSAFPVSRSVGHQPLNPFKLSTLNL